MGYFDQISPATYPKVLVDLTEFTKPHQEWRVDIERQITAAEGKLNTYLENESRVDEAALLATVTAAGQAAIAAGDDPVNFAAYLPTNYPECQAFGQQLKELRGRVFDGPRWTLQWAAIDTAAAARALKNLEIIHRRHPDWGIEQSSLVAFLAAHHQAQAGEPAPGEIYDTLASRSEFADVWRYVSARFREEFPDIFASDAATLKNVFCGRALATALAGTPQN